MFAHMIRNLYVLVYVDYGCYHLGSFSTFWNRKKETLKYILKAHKLKFQ